MKTSNLHMISAAGFGVAWNDEQGLRYHVWLECKDGEPVRPFRVRLAREMGTSKERRTIYVNPPAMVERRSQGHFDTRKRNECPFLRLSLMGLSLVAVRRREAMRERRLRSQVLERRLRVPGRRPRGNDPGKSAPQVQGTARPAGTALGLSLEKGSTE